MVACGDAARHYREHAQGPRDHEGTCPRAKRPWEGLSKGQGGMIGGIIGVYWTLQEAEGGMTREGRPTYKSGRPIDQTSQFASCHSTIVWTRGPTTVCNSTLEDFDSVWLLAVALIANLYNEYHQKGALRN